jgi:hypothetical protein
MTLGGVGMYAASARFRCPGGVLRDALGRIPSLLALTMLGFGFGGILWAASPIVTGDGAGPARGGDARTGLAPPRAMRRPVGIRNRQGIPIGFFGSSALFVPLVADTSLWFTRCRGIAVAICASGNYLVMPSAPILQHFSNGRLAPDLRRRRHFVSWRCCSVFALRRRPPAHAATGLATHASRVGAAPGFAGRAYILQVAGRRCVAMSMPVHIVASGILISPQRAEMLSLMLGFGIVSLARVRMDLRSHR